MSGDASIAAHKLQEVRFCRLGYCNLLHLTVSSTAGQYFFADFLIVGYQNRKGLLRSTNRLEGVPFRDQAAQ